MDKKNHAAIMQDVVTEKNEKSSFATQLRDDIYNFTVRGAKLDVSGVISRATSDRKKYQSVNIYHKDLSRAQRTQLAAFFSHSKKYYVQGNGGLGINVSLRGTWNKKFASNLSELIY